MGDEIKENPRSYVGDGGQVRLEPVRQLKWGREGVHFIIGLYCGLLTLAALMWGNRMLLWLAVAMQPVVVILFIAYEVTEGWRIRDWSYRDIGGYMAGWLLGLTMLVIAGILFNLPE